jgi:hypothetical protein
MTTTNASANTYAAGVKDYALTYWDPSYDP